MLDQAEGLYQSPVKTDCSSPEPSFDFLLGHSEVELSALLDHSRTSVMGSVAILVVWYRPVVTTSRGVIVVAPPDVAFFCFFRLQVGRKACFPCWLD